MDFRFKHSYLDFSFDARREFDSGRSFIVFDEDHCYYSASANPGCFHCVYDTDNFDESFGADGLWIEQHTEPLDEYSSWIMLHRYATNKLCLAEENSDEDMQRYYEEIISDAEECLEKLK